MTCVECGRRNVTDKPRSPDGDYDTLDLETRGQQPQYDVIPRDQRHSGRHQAPDDTAADDYVTLDTETLGQQNPYDDIRPAIYLELSG